MKVCFIRSWQGYKPGQEFNNFADGFANILIKRGIIVRVEAELPKKKQRKEYATPQTAAHA